MSSSGGRWLAFAVFIVGASLGCDVDSSVPVGGGCSSDPTQITCEQFLAGDVRGDHPSYRVNYRISPCEPDDVACFQEATGVPTVEVRGFDLRINSYDLPALCMGPFAPRIVSLGANVDGRCYTLD